MQFATTCFLLGMINALSGKVSAASMFSATKRENIFFVRREAFPVAFVDERPGLTLCPLDSAAYGKCILYYL